MDRHQGARIAVHGSADDVLCLANWLMHEKILRGRMGMSTGIPQTDHMGASAEIALGVLSSGAVVALAQALKTWLVQRRSDVCVVVTTADGRSVSLSAHRVDRAQELILGVLGQVAVNAGHRRTSETTDEP